ncbi:MAG TPA: glycosyl transferase [Cyanobacteria bacterium UBA11149]|nr:glycosyl transferase [Cyanobacteria bacterium UBA11367]HBE60184.1 glycosyl transferase [Cyanobacteria bacterium UBA11366]HBK66848.1 glycosyl transferase [Cyanobacteria bacterium UBA11166]HBR75503.1 glycosyl transferase [Cyanobacteria bacterium UBA11159]HBS70601.1 glycosyl transferase [Cyanobacteria bacterium UBA11153]HBW88793.1 glycosyl transferase [Cyanobacteria bacterium UBA11149]HCA98242.1 glycosyl transferase [Cyanobacteria bacterium UBA9226]
MFRPVLYIAITSHGFGHAVRASSVAAEIQKLCPNILLILVTTAPRWLLESYIPGNFIHRPRAFDVGVIQPDSLNMDKEATLAKLKEIRAAQHSIISSEVNFIRTNRVGLILADIPPLAAKIAQGAGIPCWMMGNFGWDFIYREWGGEFTEIANWIKNDYQFCDRLFRLPLHEPMTAFPNITDVGLTGGLPSYTVDRLRQTFGLNIPIEKTILITFGGLGVQQIPYHNVCQFPDWQFITFDLLAPDFPNLLKVKGHEYRPVDFMPLCGRVLSKPGYSTFAEALCLDIPIVSLTREDFAESDILLRGIENYAHHQILNPTEFFSGNWEFLLKSPQPPTGSQFLDKNGTNAIALQVVSYFQPEVRG